MKISLFALVFATLLPLSGFGADGGAHTIVYTPIADVQNSATINVGNIEQYQGQECSIRLVAENYAKRSPIDGDPTQGIIGLTVFTSATGLTPDGEHYLQATNAQGQTVFFSITRESISRLKAGGDTVRIDTACWR